MDNLLLLRNYFSAVVYYHYSSYAVIFFAISDSDCTSVLFLNVSSFEANIFERLFK